MSGSLPPALCMRSRTDITENVQTRLTSVTNPGMLSLAYAVGFTYTFDLLYTSLCLLSSGVWGLCTPELLPGSCLISTMESTCANKTEQAATRVKVRTDRNGG